MMRTDRVPWPRTLGISAGLALAALGLASWRVSAGTVAPGADVTVSAAPSGELALRPATPIVDARGLAPGKRRRASGRLRVRNLTAARLDVRMRAVADGDGLDRLLRLEVAAGGRSLARGTLEELASWSRRRLALNVGAERTLAVRAWLPRSVGDAHRALAADVRIELRASPRSSQR